VREVLPGAFLLIADQVHIIAQSSYRLVMATASPTPLGSSHFSQLNRRPSRQTHRQPPTRPHLALSGSSLPVSNGYPTAHARQLSLNDSSDDEIPVPMKFSALTKALLNDDASILPPSSPVVSHNNLSGSTVVNEGVRHIQVASEGLQEEQVRDRTSSPETRVNSPFPRRIVRLSGTPRSSTIRRTSSLSSTDQKYNGEATKTETDKAESPLDLNTPIVRTVRIPVTAPGNYRLSVGSSGRLSSRTNSGARKEGDDLDALEDPATISRTQAAINYGSVSRYGTIGRSRYGEETGMQGSMRPKWLGKVAGTFLSGPARRGRQRQSEGEQEPSQENEDGLGTAFSSQEPESQGSQDQEPLSSQEHQQEPISFYAPKHRDFASGSPVNANELSKPQRNSSPQSLSRSSQAPLVEPAKKLSPQKAQPVFRIPAPRPDLPSAHDQENEAPPTFKRNKPVAFVHLDKIEKVAIRPQADEIGTMYGTISPSRRPLATRSQNTPHRVAPPPPKMSKLETATATGGAAATSHASKKGRNNIRVNGKVYTRMDVIGRGGSSKVWRVMAENYKVFALKRVSLEDADENAIRGYKGEIDLLRKLEGNDRVVDMLDYEMNDEKQTLSVVSTYHIL
jgi:serine/threonine-protein kinase TTK/MPS1